MFKRTMPPCVLANPAFAQNVPPILRRALRAAKVRKYAPPGNPPNRERVGMDGAIYGYATEYKKSVRAKCFLNSW